MMETNIPLNHTLAVYDVSADDFGDIRALGEPHNMAALIESTDGLEFSNYQEEATGTMIATIRPSEPFYLSKKGRMTGLVARFDRYSDTLDDQSWYRVNSGHPGESLVDGTPDLVILTLSRISARKAAA